MKYFYKLFFCTLITYLGFSQNQPSCPWDLVFTASNATIAIQESNFENIVIEAFDTDLNPITIPLTQIDCPMWIGVSSIINKDLSFGYTQWDSLNSIALAAWGDDSTTPETDGFLEGESYFFSLCIDGVTVYGNQLVMSTESPFSSTYTNNGFASVESIAFQWDSAFSLPSCFSTDLSDHEQKKSLIKEFDLYGREINSSTYTGLSVQIFNDQTFVKKYKF
tara:strand:+ start:553 stop:1215 length:663 start_codon:yes stop_codon:yes gene_type:complete